MLNLSSSKGIRIDVSVLSVSRSVEDHSVIIQALRKELIEREASDTGGVPCWKSSCQDRLAEATGITKNSGFCHFVHLFIYIDQHDRCSILHFRFRVPRYQYILSGIYLQEKA